MINVIIPMAGLGSRFVDYGFKINKYLLPINLNLTTMIEYAITTLNINEECRYIFIIRKSEDSIIIENILKEICDKHHYKYDILYTNILTDGPASTEIIAFNELKDINIEDELIISNSDQVLEWNFNSFIKTSRNYDGCVLTYTPSYIPELGTLDKHSFIELDSNNYGIRVTEKIVISDNTLVGVHYFKKSKYFIDNYNYMVKNNIRAPNGEFYISLVYQSMIENNYKISIHKLQDSEYFHPVGEPLDYFNYLYLHGGYNNKLTTVYDNTILYNDDNVLLTYKIYNEPSIKIDNDGLILVLKGTIKTYDNDIITQGFVTNKNLITLPDEVEVLIIKSLIIDTKLTNIWNTTNFIRGWFIGDFIPSIVKTDLFEIALLNHLKDEMWDFHYHRYMIEINVLIKGKMIINEQEIHEGNIFIFEKNQIACPKFLEDCSILCIKVPSVKNDKIII